MDDRRIGHVLRHGCLLREIIEGRIRGNPTKGRRRIQMLHDSAKDDGYVALKRAAEDGEGWRHRERMSRNLLLCSRRLPMMSIKRLR